MVKIIILKLTLRLFTCSLEVNDLVITVILNNVAVFCSALFYNQFNYSFSFVISNFCMFASEVGFYHLSVADM